jgi:hypothetical protein
MARSANFLTTFLANFLQPLKFGKHIILGGVAGERHII